MKFLRWEKCDFSEYERACRKFDFNAESSPEYIQMALAHGASLKFYAYIKNGITEGAVCTDNGWLAHDHKNPKNSLGWMSLPKYAIYLPFNENIKCILPFKTKSLSLRNKQFYNSSFSLFSKRQVAIAKNINELSSKTKSTRKREVRKFIEQGGEFKNINTVDADFLFENYYRLYAIRRNLTIKPDPLIRSLFCQLHEKSHFFGHIAFFAGEAVGIQLILSTETEKSHFLDFINIGYDISLHQHPIGTMLMWENLCLANDIKKPLTYSYGMMSGQYKKRWCHPVSVGRTLC
ncbi:transcriptional regulator [Enterobacteriaceae bacterium ESL0689]|nr:transcriptional regulator [Enterobacteriaceae bacterium ESL0689]